MEPQSPAPLTPEEQADLRNCEAEIKASLDKYSCDIQGVVQMTTGNIVVNSVIVKVRKAETPAPAAGVGAASASPAA